MSKPRKLNPAKWMRAAQPEARTEQPKWVRQESCSQCDGDGCAMCESAQPAAGTTSDANPCNSPRGFCIDCASAGTTGARESAGAQLWTTDLTNSDTTGISHYCIVVGEKRYWVQDEARELARLHNAELAAASGQYQREVIAHFVLGVLDGCRCDVCEAVRDCAASQLKERELELRLSRQLNDMRERSLAELREQRRWIPVEERLPENSGHYLVVVSGPTDDGDEYTGVTLGQFKPELRWVTLEGWDHHEITHWKPLDAAPALLSDSEKGA